MLLDGFCVGGFRSFGEAQYIGPLTKISVFAGPNNTGKSNILRFVTDHLRTYRGNSGDFKYAGLNQPLRGNREVFVGFAASREHHRIADARTKATEEWQRLLLEKLFNCPELTLVKGKGELLWFVKRSADGKPGKYTYSLENIEREASVPGSNWRVYLELLRSNSSSGGQVTHWISELLEVLSPFGGGEIKTAMIDAIRQVSEGEYDGHSGRGLIGKLAALQHPPYDRQQDRKRFDAIDDFVRDVTENATARIEIPDDRKTITVHMDGKVLPLESLGTGIHEVVILAAASTILEGHIVSLEEPEIHLHPIYQRKLLRYLHNNTTNQYLVATHSAHLLDAPEATIFHVTMEYDQTRVRRIVSAQHRWDVSRELGARASDVVQSNSAVWVEGPSDRIYLMHWIRAVAPELIEGVHYSVLFYGGKVLSHFTADHDPEVNDLVSMLAANRHSAIVMDRDKGNANDPINATKRRVKDELGMAGGICWITAGREVENYVPSHLLATAIATVKKIAVVPKFRQFGKVLPEKIDKVKVALAIVQSEADMTKLDLHARVVDLVQFIRQANHLPKKEVSAVTAPAEAKPTRTRRATAKLSDSSAPPTGS